MKIPCPICKKTDFAKQDDDLCPYCGFQFYGDDYREYKDRIEELDWVRRLRKEYEESVKKYGDELWYKRFEKEIREKNRER